MTRRQFAFWLGFGLFNLSEKLSAQGLDRLAAATMRAAGPSKSARAAAAKSAVHWTRAGDEMWHWFERESLIKGEWRATGTTTPINKKTGERKWEPGGYLDENLVPAEMRIAARPASDVSAHSDAGAETHSTAAQLGEMPDAHLPTRKRRGRHGRPPSKWLRSLHAYELRTWLKTIDVPEAEVSGMSYWTHLTRDHLFDADRILGLTKAEQAKLHAAAHFGY